MFPEIKKCVFVIIAGLTPLVCCLKLGAFNIQVFGATKVNKENVVNTLAKIMARYDIVLIQEIRDQSDTAIRKLISVIQQKHGINFGMEISERVGRTVSKEQYGFLYRKDQQISVVKSYMFDDGDELQGTDLFEREPFVVRFQALNCAVTDFTLIALHSSPSKTVAEITALMKVYENVHQSLATSNIIILGDLNADCSFMPKKAWSQIEIRQNKLFWWPIDDDVDTTVGNMDCAYDRFIIAGSTLKNAIVTGSVKTFNFQIAFGLNNSEALEVSDHYPIELELRGKHPKTSAESAKMDFSASAGVYDFTACKISMLFHGLYEIWSGLVEHFSSWLEKSEL